MKLRRINDLTKTAFDNLAEKYYNDFKDELEQKEYDRKLLDRFSDMLRNDLLICDSGCGPAGQFNRILKPGGKVLIAVKKGNNEGITDHEWYQGNSVYFTFFKEQEIEDYCTNSNFRIDYIDTRKPYDFEIDVERIYATGTKI